MFGFGTGVWLFLFVPFLNLLFMPAADCGKTTIVGPRGKAEKA